MGDKANAGDTEKRWMDYKTVYPRTWRVLQRITVLWATGGLLGVFLIEYFLLPKDPLSGLFDIRLLTGLGWFAVGGSLALVLGTWQSQIKRQDHLRQLSPDQSTVQERRKPGI